MRSYLQSLPIQGSEQGNDALSQGIKVKLLAMHEVILEVKLDKSYGYRMSWLTALLSRASLTTTQRIAKAKKSRMKDVGSGKF